MSGWSAPGPPPRDDGASADAEVRAETPPRDVTGRPRAFRRVDLDRFFTPRTVAVLGASDAPSKPNTAMWRKIRAKAEVVGAAIYPVNPGRTEVDGLPCFPGVREIPAEELDLSVLVAEQLSGGVEMLVGIRTRRSGRSSRWGSAGCSWRCTAT